MLYYHYPYAVNQFVKYSEGAVPKPPITTLKFEHFLQPT